MHQNNTDAKKNAWNGVQSSAPHTPAELLDSMNREIAALTALTAEVKGLAQNAVGNGAKDDSGHVDRETQRNGKSIDLVGFLFRLFERFWLIALAAIIGTVGAWFYARRTVPVYSATAKMYIVSPGDSLINFSDLQLGTVLTYDYQEVFKTWEVHEMVRRELNLGYSYQQMQAMLNVENPEDTRILHLTVANPNPQLAADIANAYVHAAKVFIVDRMHGEEPTNFSEALTPSVPINGSKRSTVIKGFLLGTVLMVGLLFVQYVLDDRPQTPEDIRTYAGIPTLAILPSVKEAKRKRQSKRETTPSHQENRLS